jgi:hypothetical protein
MKTVKLKSTASPSRCPKARRSSRPPSKVAGEDSALCYHPDLPAWAACGICVVKVEGPPKMLRACATPGGGHEDHHPRPGDRTRSAHGDRADPLHASERLPAVPAQRQLRAAEAGGRLRHPRGALRAPRARPARGRHHAVDRAQPGEVHQVRALRHRLPADAERLGAGVHRPRREDAHRAGRRHHPGRVAPASSAASARRTAPWARSTSRTRPAGLGALRDPEKHCVVQIAPAVRVASARRSATSPARC